MKLLFALCGILLGVYLLFIALLYFFQNKMVYFPPDPALIGMHALKGFKAQELETSDGLKLKAYYRAPANGKPVIVEFHGNGSHPAWEAPKFLGLIREGYGVLLAEYRGYGGNAGIPDEGNLYRDGDAYLRWVTKNPDLKNNPVVIYGSSIGSGVAVDAAKNYPEISALILEVPFDRLSDVGAFHYPYIPLSRYLMRNKFDNAAKIKDVHVPVLFLLARKDRVVPFRFGENLANLANEPKLIRIFDDADHVDVYRHGAAEAVRDFLKDLEHD